MDEYKIKFIYKSEVKEKGFLTWTDALNFLNDFYNKIEVLEIIRI